MNLVVQDYQDKNDLMIKFNNLIWSLPLLILYYLVLMRSLDETPEEMFKDVIEDFDDGSIDKTQPILHTYWTTPSNAWCQVHPTHLGESYLAQCHNINDWMTTLKCLIVYNGSWWWRSSHGEVSQHCWISQPQMTVQSKLQTWFIISIGGFFYKFWSIYLLKMAKMA